MFRTSKAAGFALGVAFLLTPSMALADEVSSTSVKTETPVGSSSRSVKVKSNAAGTSQSVKHSNASPGQANSTSYRAETGIGGAKVEKEQTGVRANIDGSVTADKSKESHAVGVNGSAHKKANSSTTVGADGSSSTIKSEKQVTNP